MILPISMPGPWEMMLIVIVVLLIFGGKKLPELAKGIGQGIREFKAAMSDTGDEVKRQINAPDKSASDKDNPKPLV